jgi:hypothetical protein
MSQIGNEKHPVVMKSKNKGNRTLGFTASGSFRMTKEEREQYNKNWDRIFGKKKHNSKQEGF